MGEVCSAGSRLLVDKRIAQEFTARFIERGQRAYIAGTHSIPRRTWGRCHEEAARARAGLHCKGRDEGAKLEFGGDVLTGRLLRQPGLVHPVDNGMTIAQEEIFGRLRR